MVAYIRKRIVFFQWYLKEQINKNNRNSVFLINGLYLILTKETGTSQVLIAKKGDHRTSPTL